MIENLLIHFLLSGQQVVAGQTAALALKRVKRSSLRKVMSAAASFLYYHNLLHIFHCARLLSVLFGPGHGVGGSVLASKGIMGV